MSPSSSDSWGTAPPGASRDARAAAAESMLGHLAAAFPQAGLGVTGSVSTGTHHAGSDLDLVVVDASFRRDMQFATMSEGVRTAVLCLRPGFDAQRERRWMLAAGSDTAMVAMVRTAVVARDPAGCLRELQRTVARLDGERLARRDELIALRWEHALAARRALAEGPGADQPHLQLELFTAVVDGWLLREGRVIRSRQESQGVLEAIERCDAALAALLREAIPLTRDSTAPLLRAADHVFGPVDAR
jgi:hypothetical protein